jgi:hypothetical protein
MLKSFVSQIAFLIIILNAASAQCPTTPVSLTTQSAIDNFSTTYSGCDTIPIGADVLISGTTITNLNGLSQILVSNAAIEIRNNPNLTTTSGLNLVYAGSDLILRDNPLLTDISSFSNLDTILGEFTIRTNNSLVDLSGFSSLKYVGMGAIIRDNASLTSLNGLNQLTTVDGILEIVEHPNLTDVSALSNLDLVTGDPIEGALVIDLNTSLTSLNGLGNNNTVIMGDLFITGNMLLSDCAVQSICNYLNNPPVGAISTINLNDTGCNTETEILNQCLFISVYEVNHFEVLEVYPNPFNNQLIFELSGSNLVLTIHDLSGKLIHEQTMINTKTILNTEWLSKGSYLISIANQDQSFSKKMILIK